LKILFIHNGGERFVRHDHALLSEHHTLTEWYQPQRTFNVVELAKQVARHDLIYGWFASWHTFTPVLLAKWLRKPTVIVIGGFEIARLPEIDYGSQRGGFKQWVTRTVLRLADQLITCSTTAKEEAIRNADADAQKITPIYPFVETIPTQVNPDRQRQVITVGGVSQSNLLRKGLIHVARAAEQLPEWRVTIAGSLLDPAAAQTLRLPNVELTGRLAEPDLIQLYTHASVYVQASAHETFAVSAVEGMAYGCLPVATRAGALPEVLGEHAVYLDSTAPRSVADAIHAAAAKPFSARQAAHQSVRARFTRELRLKAVQSVIEKAITPQS
jgi:glycosyltransferase involved in cell wall biosynthesis